jgi:hypothetical protein
MDKLAACAPRTLWRFQEVLIEAPLTLQDRSGKLSTPVEAER